MNTILRALRDFIVSLKLTVALLVFGMLLVFAATLDQTNLGIWGIQQKWFRSFVVWQNVGGGAVPIFPGGYLVGGLLVINLVAAHLYRFVFAWRKAGILLAHAGLILLLVGELLSGLWQRDYSMRLAEGETKNYAESFRDFEVALSDTTDATADHVVAIPEQAVAKGTPVQHPRLPFRVVPKVYYPNAQLQTRPAASGVPAVATAGFGTSVLALPQPVTYKTDERNQPAAFLELVASDRTLGTWLVSPQFVMAQEFEYAGRHWKIELRPVRLYQPFTLTLLKFSHDRYPGTDIPKNFSSRLRLRTPDGRDDRDVLVYMNNPLRYAGLTFYQAGFENNDRVTILQVVRNPSWLLPYVACAAISLGLALQFGVHLIGFVARRRPARAAVPAAAEKSRPLPVSP